MTSKERAEAIRYDQGGYIDEDNQFYPDYDLVRADVAKAIDAAVKEEREQIAKFIEEQNAMCNEMFDEPLHDAFTRDICKAIRQRGQQ